jgi:hypothetical protein
MGGSVAQQIIFSGATLVLCAFFFAYFYLYIRRRTSRGSILAGYREEVDRLIAEIDHATDRDARLVEERITALRKILEDADRRIALLSRDMERRRSGTELYTALGNRQGGPAGTPVPPGPSRPLPDAAGGTGAVSRSPGGEEPAGAGEGNAPGKAPAGNAALNPGPGVLSPDTPAPSLTGQVAELSRQGISAERIAARLGLSLSEVELALAVYRRTGA